MNVAELAFSNTSSFLQSLIFEAISSHTVPGHCHSLHLLSVTPGYTVILVTASRTRRFILTIASGHTAIYTSASVAGFFYCHNIVL